LGTVRDVSILPTYNGKFDMDENALWIGEPEDRKQEN